MRTISNNFQAASQQLQTGEVFLTLLHIQVQENNGDITNLYYVNDNVDVVSNGVTYERAAFELDLGGDFADKTPTTTLKFDAGDRQLIRKLRELDARPQVNLSIVLASNPNVTEIGPITYETDNYQVSESVVSMNLTVEPILNEPIPCDKYTPTLFPGLWGNVSITHVPDSFGREPGSPTQDIEAMTEGTLVNATGHLVHETWDWDTITQWRVTYRDNQEDSIYGMQPGSHNNTNIMSVSQEVREGEPRFYIILHGKRDRNFFDRIVTDYGVLYTKDAEYTIQNSVGRTRWDWKADVLPTHGYEEDQRFRII